MGATLIDENMRAVSVLFTIAFIAAAFAATHDEIHSEATELISDMKKKGATEADCKDLAKTTCKEVVDEQIKDQKVINSQSNGSECDRLGVKQVTYTVKHYHKRVKQWTTSKKTITKWANHRINLGTKAFISLKAGKCGFIFASRSYRTIYAKYHSAVKYERTVRGWVIDAKKRARQLKALQKCKMMQCVLNGTPLKSSKCKAVLPKLHNKKLHKFAEWAHKTGKCGAFAKAAAAKRKRMEAQEKARIKARERQQKAAEKKSKAARKAAEKKRKAEWKYSTVGTGYCNKFVWVTPAARFPKCQRGLGAVNRYCGPYNVQSTDPDHRKQKNSFTVKGCFKLCASYYGHKVGRWGNNMKGIRLVNQGLGVNLNNKIGHQFFLGRFGNSNGNACGCCGQGSNGRSARFWGACTTYKMVSYPGFRRL